MEPRKVRIVQADAVKQAEGNTGRLVMARDVRRTGVEEHGTSMVGLPRNLGGPDTSAARRYR